MDLARWTATYYILYFVQTDNLAALYDVSWGTVLMVAYKRARSQSNRPIKFFQIQTNIPDRSLSNWSFTLNCTRGLVIDSTWPFIYSFKSDRVDSYRYCSYSWFIKPRLLIAKPMSRVARQALFVVFPVRINEPHLPVARTHSYRW